MSSQPGRLRLALPALLRAGFAEAVAYRAEFLVWFLAYTMPLIMMALWTAVAREQPVGRYGEREFAAYFMITLIVRVLTGSWVVWEMTMEIRAGTLSQRLLRPIHPLLGYACENVAALPMRLVLVAPVFVLTMLWLGPGILTRDPIQALALPLAFVGAWIMMFAIMAAIGSLALWWESSLSLFDVFLGLYTVLSGYVMPLDLFPPAVRSVLDWLPFRYMLSFPVEAALGLHDRATTLQFLGVQWAWALALVLLLRATWRRSVRRFQAYGG